MSAILGRINFDDSPIQSDGFFSAFASLSQYGSDGSTHRVDGSVALGQHVLHFTPDSQYERGPALWDEMLIVADVRLDNRTDLCDGLALSSAERATVPDSQLIAQAYRRWGSDCTTKLLGDFAFAIWDQREKRVFCARDPIGSRPFYYFHTPSTFVFATDIRALKCFPDVNCDLDEYEILSFLILPYYARNKTFFKNIHFLPPGQQITINASGLRAQTYWSPENAPDVHYKSLSEYHAHFRDLLETAVAARVRTSYPVAAHISGGLDSSGVAVLANRQLRKHNRSLAMAYTWSPAKSEAYPAVRGDERDRIEALCVQENIPCHYGTATAQDFRDFIARDIATESTNNLFEELPVMAHAGAHGIRAILSGWGGDEAATFDGRGYAAYLLRRGNLPRLIAIARREVGLRHSWSFVRRNAIIPLLPDALYERVDPILPFDRQSVAINPAFAARFAGIKPVRPNIWREIADPRQTQILLIQHGHLADRMATWAHWSSAHRVLYQYPLTDRRILEFAVGLPPALLYQNGEWRSLFRDTLGNLLPRSVGSKDDDVNERKRADLRLACWQMLAEEVREGKWDRNDVDWLALDTLRARLQAVPDSMALNQIVEFSMIVPTVRIWHLWQRYIGP